MSEFRIKRGDTRPSLEAQLLDEDREPRNLEAVDSVSFHMSPIDELSASVDSEATVISESDAKVVYEWSEEDTEVAGRYKAEFEITYNSGSVETFPNSNNIDVYITEDLA